MSICNYKKPTNTYFCCIKGNYKILKVWEALNLNILFACLSCVLFFLEPSPFLMEKLPFIIIVIGIVWSIYTVDHLLDGFKTKGKSGIFRHDFSYTIRFILIPITFCFLGTVCYFIYLSINELYIYQGLWLSPIIPIYFYLKHSNKLKPLNKMLIISALVATVIVNLYYPNFYDIFKFEWLLMFLLVLLNQLILKHYECNLDDEKLEFKELANRIFIWILVLLGISTLFNLAALPQTISMLLIALGLKMILSKTNIFKGNLWYRFGADCIFILLWPLFKLFQFVFISLI